MKTRFVELIQRALSEKQAATYLGLSESSLRKSRMDGRRANRLEPPPFVKIGRRVVYLIDDLRSYLENHRAPTR